MVRDRYAFSAAELAAQRDAERAGEPFLVYRDGAGDLRLARLAGAERVTVGRGAGNDVALEWDAQVSRAHARLERHGGAWTVVDAGLSRNGSFVNGERVLGGRRLRDGDLVRVGTTTLLCRIPGEAADDTAPADDAAALVRLTPAQKRVLVALCRPFASRAIGTTPASNGEIATALTLSLDGVKTHMRALFRLLEVDELPQNRKRAELARRALATGLVTERDLRG